MSTAEVTFTPTPRSVYLPAIDGLRAFAVAAVLLFHSDHLSGGFLGVDTFFVLSGFLITRQMLQEVDKTGRISLRDFWSRRARRLLPALLLLIAIATVVATGWGTAGERLKIRNDAPWALGFALNWHHVAGSADYWASLAAPSPLTHLWSLAVEEQFYLIWPLVVVALIWRRTNRERAVLTGSIIGAALSFALMAAVYSPTNSTRAYEGTDTRIGALLIGALCATTIVTSRTDRLVARLGRSVGVIVVAPVLVLAWMWLRVDGRDGWLYRGGFLLHAVLVAVLLLAVASQAGSNWLQQLLRQRPIRWLGQLSYGLYLWHWPIYIALNADRTGLSRWPLTAMRLATTLAASTLSYYLVERPIRYGLQRRKLTLTAVASVVGVALVAVGVVVVPLPSAGPAPIDLSALAVPAAQAGSATTSTTATSSTTTTSSTTATDPATTDPVTTDPASDSSAASTDASIAATTTDPATTTTVIATITTIPTAELHKALWFGDSIAFTTSLGFIAAMKATGIDVIDSSFPGVGLLNDTGPADFKKITDLTGSEHPDLLIMEMSTWDEPFGVDAIYDALAKVRDIAKFGGAKLLLLPVPPLTPERTDHGYVNDTAAAKKIAADDPAEVTFLDTNPFWGPDFVADMNGDHIPERMDDGVHLCPSGSALFAIWLVTQLQTMYANVTLADVSTWAGGDWTQDRRYSMTPGGCALLP
ncbi:MAG: putative acyltransferase [Acidimicrobiales bacterium]|nr:putative acyltransferase [Acidimicrobiales bacterium]